MLAAPSKTLLWFEESEHEPFVDEADKFNTLMAELVRPVADVTCRSGSGEVQGRRFLARSIAL
jgi:hypothetical protein